MGYDHPIAWCKPYDGGRAFVTALGHFGAHYSEPEFLDHLVGGIQYAAGLVPGDCGGTVNANFEKVALDDNTSAPVRARRGARRPRLLHRARQGPDPRRTTRRTAASRPRSTLDVYSGGEDGLLGIAVDPDFATNDFIYVYYAPDRPNNGDPSSFFSQVSRFTVDANSSIDPASERKIIEIPARREPDEPGHTGGGLDFDLQGNLLLGVGDDVNPHSEPSGGYAPLSERDRHVPRRPRDVGQHERPARQAPADHARAAPTRPATRSRRATSSPRRRTRRTRRGPRSTRWASATRSASPSTRRRAGSASPTTRPTPARTRRPRAARPASSSGT